MAAPILKQHAEGGFYLMPWSAGEAFARRRDLSTIPPQTSRWVQVRIQSIAV